MPRLIPAVVSVLLLLLVLHDAFEVMLLPRRVKSRLRIVRLFFRFTWLIWSRTARRISSPETRHNYLSLYGPLSMVWLLVVWASGLIFGFGTLYWTINSGGVRLAWMSQLYFSGVTFFTLGYGDLVPHTSVARLLVVLEAGTGLGFIAIVIGYLPVLYQLFARREAKVILLDAVAGSPPSAVTLLARHAEAESMPELDDLLHEWQQWCAELMESQLSYPMLAFYRSQHDNQSWLAALTTVLDTCAVLMTQIRDVNTYQAQVTFAIARHAAVDLALVLRAKAPASALERLTAEQFTALRSSLEAAGVPLRDVAGGEEALRTLRANYEPFVRGIGERLLLIVPPLMTEDGVPDNWQRSAWMKPTPGIGKLPTPTPNEGHFG